MPTLVCSSVRYYSPNDEKSFFDWLDRISCVVEVYGQGKELYIEVKRQKISDSNLRDLLALFKRYDVDVNQLRQFETNKNAGKFW